MRVVALLATYNEERFIAGCLENLARQGVEVFLIDNESTDSTIDIARKYKNVIDIESFPSDGIYRWRPILQRKEELAASLDADWFMHVDADERHLPPKGTKTIVEALRKADHLGYSAAQFYEFTFTPTAENPDHDNPDFEKTMKWYYFFAPRTLHLMRIWKKQVERVDISSSAGHHVVSPNLKLYPEPFLMRHYLYLSKEHAIRKYALKQFDASELKDHWHGWRAKLASNAIHLPSEKLLNLYNFNNKFDISNPWKRRWIEVSLDLYNKFYIKDGYKHRSKPEYFADVMMKDTGIIHQPDVYPLAAELGRELDCKYIIDIGCGRGEKLAILHPKFDIIGVDYEENIKYCQKTYPFGHWIEHNLDKDVLSFDAAILERSVLICSDVIEHLVNPNWLISHIATFMDKAKVAILTTPERDLVRGSDDIGPPINTHHVREWNSLELRNLLQVHGLNIGFIGLTNNNSRDKQKKTTIVLLNNNKSVLNLGEILDYLGMRNIFTPVDILNGSDFRSEISHRVLSQTHK